MLLGLFGSRRKLEFGLLKNMCGFLTSWVILYHVIVLVGFGTTLFADIYVSNFGSGSRNCAKRYVLDGRVWLGSWSSSSLVSVS